MGPHVALVGLMASGKTSVGSALAERLGRPYRDSDRDIEARYGETGREIAAREGVPRLHELEAEALRDALASDTPSVVGAAASALDRPELVGLLDGRAFVVWLDPPIEVLADRLASGAHRRPLAAAEAELTLQRRAREQAFASIADLVLRDVAATPDELAARIAERLADGKVGG